MEKVWRRAHSKEAATILWRARPLGPCVTTGDAGRVPNHVSSIEETVGPSDGAFMNSKYLGLSIGISLGICFSAALGIAMGDAGVGIAIGVSLGTAFSLALGAGSDEASARRKPLPDKPLP